MDIHVQAPETTSRELVQAGLSAVADDLNVDITVSM
jgi:glycine cleavage system regulatory protein